MRLVRELATTDWHGVSALRADGITFCASDGRSSGAVADNPHPGHTYLKATRPTADNRKAGSRGRHAYGIQGAQNLSAKNGQSASLAQGESGISSLFRNRSPKS